MASEQRIEPLADAGLGPREEQDGDEHDRGLIAERLDWTPEQRLDANAAFLHFYFSIRPQGPLIRDE